MTNVTCSQLHELAEELALDTLPGDVRSHALEHLEWCAACRERVENLSATADELLFVAPHIDPPAGFEQRVLARVTGEGRRPRRLRAKTLGLLAVAAALVTLVGGVATVVTTTRAHHSQAAERRELRTVRLIATSGRAVGDVSSYAGHPAWLFMRVDRSLPDGTYRCVVDADRGPGVPIGTLTVTHGHGAWGQRVAIDASRLRTARLLTPSGATIAVATLH